MPISTAKSPTSAVAAPSSKCARRSTPQRTRKGGMIMNFIPKMNRRSFVVGAAAVGGGLSIGFELPIGPQVVRAADGAPEIGVWVVIRPDETVVIRTARSEMG